MVSIICVYNDNQQYYKFLESLKKQAVQYEVVGVDNCNNSFTSCASALNYGAKKAIGDIFIFSHQDIRFKNDDSLMKFISFCESNENKIVGAFGARRYEGDDKYYCDSVDECFFGMSRSIFEELGFNEQICDGWHLYAVEMCLRGKDTGIESYRYNCGIEHLSGGVVNKDYMKTFKILLHNYKHQKYIWTTCKKMPCNLIYYNVYLLFWNIKKKLMGNYHLVENLKRIFHQEYK